MRMLMLVFTDFPHGSAMGRRAFMLAKGLKNAGADINVIVGQAFDEETPSSSIIEDIPIFWLQRTSSDKFHNFFIRLSARWGVFMESYHRIRRDKVEAILLINPEIDRLIYLIYKYIFKIKIFVTIDDEREKPIRFKINHWWLFLRGRFSDWVFVRFANKSMFATDYLLRQHCRKNGPSAQVLPLMVDTTRFSPDNAKKDTSEFKLNIGRKFLFGYFGTFWHVEGVALLLQAIKELSSNKKDFAVYIAGKEHMGFECDPVAQIVDNLELREFVIQGGWLGIEDLIEIMCRVDCFVVPKLDHSANYAGMPGKLAEYLSMGACVITSSIGEIPMYIEHRINGILITPSSLESLVMAMRDVLETPEEARLIGINGRSLASVSFDYKNVGLNVYQFLLME